MTSPSAAIAEALRIADPAQNQRCAVCHAPFVHLSGVRIAPEDIGSAIAIEIAEAGNNPVGAVRAERRRAGPLTVDDVPLIEIAGGRIAPENIVGAVFVEIADAGDLVGRAAHTKIGRAGHLRDRISGRWWRDRLWMKPQSIQLFQVDRVSDPAHAGRTQVALLHSRFIQEHRRKTEVDLRQAFGRPQPGEMSSDSRIIVATQAIASQNFDVMRDILIPVVA